MAKNEFKPFATGAGANVIPQADWENLPALQTGFQSGKASSAQVNKAIRQASFIAAAFAQFVSNKTGTDVLDDGDLGGFITKLTNGFGKQYLTRNNPFADIKSDGTSAVATALENLGLGDGSALPVGVPVPWPLAVPPTGWLKCNGAAFNKTANPKLAAIYPSGVLPDMRGQTIRGWDDGRGIDTGRVLLSEQGDAIRQMSGSVANVWTSDPNTAVGVLSYGGTGAQALMAGTGIAIQFRNLSFNAASQVPTAAENRVKNIAFNWIVRAA